MSVVAETDHLAFVMHISGEYEVHLKTHRSQNYHDAPVIDRGSMYELANVISTYSRAFGNIPFHRASDDRGYRERDFRTIGDVERLREAGLVDQVPPA